MEKMIRILAAVLAAQVALAVGLQLGGPDLKPAAEPGPLLSLSSDKVKAITIARSGDQQVKLERADGGWKLAQSGFPADPDKVEQLLNQLTGFTAGDVVARTEGARKRFKVASNDFKRRITLKTDQKKPVRLLFGTSPGKDRIHVRLEGKNRIHVVQFGTYDAPVQVTDWQHKGVLQIPTDRIVGIKVDDLVLRRKDSSQSGKDTDKSGQAGQPAQWQASDSPRNKVVQQSAVRQLTQRLATLRFDEILGEQKPDGYNWEQPALRMTVERSQGGPVNYRLASKTVKHKQGEKNQKKQKKQKKQTKYALKTSSRAEYFSLANPVATQLLDAANRKALLMDKPKKKAKDSDEQSAGKDAASTTGS